MFTNGDPLSTGDNTVAGADFHYKASNFLDSGEVLEAARYVMHSTGTGGSGTAFGGRLLYPNFRWNGALVFDQTGQQFDPALGFVSLQGARVYEAWLGPRWRVARLDYLQLWPYLFLRTDLDNRIIDSQFWLPQCEIRTKSGDNLLLAPILWVEQFFEPFTLLPGVEIQPGIYSYWRYLIQVTTAETRPLSAKLSFTVGTYLHGSRFDVTAELTWRPVSWFNAQGRYEQNAIDLPGGAFTVHLAQLNVNLAFTPDLTWNLISQYDNVNKEMGFNSRIRYTIKPGADIYLVFNQLLDVSEHALVLVREDLSTKVVWTYRF